MRDMTNMGPEPIRVKKPSGRPVSMALPRVDDGNVHEAPGKKSNTTAAHYADVVSQAVLGKKAGAAWKQTSGR